jgi:hypothetical protein
VNKVLEGKIPKNSKKGRVNEMKNKYPEQFGKVLESIKGSIGGYVDCLDIRPIESNFNTKGMMFGGTKSIDTEGTILVGEDRGHIAVDISMEDGRVISFVLNSSDDKEGIQNIIQWFKGNYQGD